MPKKRNQSSGAKSGGQKSLAAIRSGGSAFRDHSVPVNTKSRKLHNKSN